MSRGQRLLLVGLCVWLLAGGGDAVAEQTSIIRLAPDTSSLVFEVQVGRKPCRMEVEDGKSASRRSFTLETSGSKVTIDMRASRRDPSDKQTFELPDQAIVIKGPWQGGARTRYVRPNLQMYGKERQLEWLKVWETLPAAADYWLTVDLRPLEQGFEVWLDGSYAGYIDGPRPDVVKVTAEEKIRGKAGSGRKSDRMLPGADPYLPLNIGFAGESSLVVEQWPWPQAPQVVADIPWIISARAADVGAVKFVPARAEECDFYLARSPLDQVRESIHFTVPPNLYARAHLLCLLDDDPAKSPEAVARITRYVYRRGVSCDAIMDSPFRLPRAGEPLSANVRLLGEVTAQQNGGRRHLPLYLVTVPLKTGAIADLVYQPHNAPLLRSEGGLDFELLGPRRMVHYASHALYPDNSVTSGVQVVGLTLEQTPFELEVTPDQPGNIFHNDEKPQLVGEIRSLLGGEVTLEWRVHDSDQTEVLQGRQRYRVAPGELPASNTSFKVGSSWSRRTWQGALTRFNIPLDKLPSGWYGIELKAYNDANKLMVEMPLTAALLGRDTRRAAGDSPYASRTSSIMQPPTPELHGILLEKAGIRGITPMSAALNVGEAGYAPWRVHGWQIPFMNSRKEDAAEAEAEIAQRIGDYLQKWPSAKSALVFHESAVGPFPPELLDQPAPESDEATQARDARLLEMGLRCAKVYREKFPHIKLQVGNGGNSLNLLAAMMRLKFPREYIDALGEESLGQTKMPETPHYEYGNGTACNFWLLQELSRKMGYGTLPVEPCSEWKGRMSTDLDDHTKAAWDMRDLLVSYAFGCRQIRTPDITDQGSMFYNNEYGSQGAVRRYPLLYPKRSYVATATLTRVLDQVELVRQVPLPQATTWVLEFKRADGNFVYACWLPRGAASLRFEFDGQTRLQHHTMLGRETVPALRRGRAEITISMAPGYLVSSRAARSVTQSATHLLPPPLLWSTGHQIDAHEAWEVVPPNTAWRRPRSAAWFDGVCEGTFELTTSSDASQGEYLVWRLLEADSEGRASYGQLRLKEPLALAGEPDTIGLLVKGNASWARLNFIIIDAEGEEWESSGADWPANLSVNFEGWQWVAFPLNHKAAWPHHIYPNWIKGYWRRTKAPAGGSGNNRIDYPVKFAGVTVAMPQRILNLTQRVPVEEHLLGLKLLGAGTGDRSAGIK